MTSFNSKIFFIKFFSSTFLVRRFKIFFLPRFLKKAIPNINIIYSGITQLKSSVQKGIRLEFLHSLVKKMSTEKLL